MDLAMLWRRGATLPWLLIDRLRESARMSYYRRIAQIGAHTRIENDGKIINPSNDPARIRIGERCVIRGELFVAAQGGGLAIGDDCFIGHESFMWAWNETPLTIGNRVLVSHHVNIHDSDSHSLDAPLRHEHFKAIARIGHPAFVPDVATAPIRIGDDAWIGYGASIAKGVTVGEGAVVGFRAMVTRDVAPWTVVAGFPARPVRDVQAAQRVRERMGVAFADNLGAKSAATGPLAHSLAAGKP
jgi:maltose O-acetyltransferase